MQETFNVDGKHFENFLMLCNSRKITCKIPSTKYLEMRDEYINKLNWWKEVQRCIDWLYDHGLLIISRARLRNWMTKSIQFNKDNELKQKQRFADKQGGYHKKLPTYRSKPDPIWEPPV